ncbi:MAG: tetratricopeptide repeat protein [Bacteroidales bacterium]|nr:tetratricopeptide repeat protein [Bacteroidales bacterium]
MSRNFHNLTSHYNIYYNGYESYSRGVEKGRMSIKNDYNRILDIFLYEDESVNSAVAGDMKRAIDKATKVITFHSITAKPKVKEGNQSAKDKAFFEKSEYNKWVDDCYMLMGKAYMYQGEFFLAAETFKHVLVTFPDEEIRFLAMTWLARAYIMIGEMREAERILMVLADESMFPEEYLEPYHTTRTQYHIKLEAYTAAAEHLEMALAQKGIEKDEKIRYSYILAQLYEETGQNNLALENYMRVTRYNPSYEMAFNAKVSMAEVYESGSTSSEDLKKLLTKMLRDSKNKEYKDQIYFALGNIAFEEGNKEQAIEYYQLSVSSSLQNQYQKGYSSLTLAEIYYKEPDYILSAAYYDSAVSFLNKDYPGYAGLTSLSASLNGLVYNVGLFELEDSVQILAGLPEEERLAIIDGIIEQVRQEEEEARLAEQQAMQDLAFNQSMLYDNKQTGGRAGEQQGGQWYFYNLNAKSFGQPEFRMKWGERNLEDNWRRKNKQSIAELTGGESVAGDSVNGGSGPAIFDNKSREYYLINIPLNDSAMEQSHLRLENALFNMGVIYKENLLDYHESINFFEELLTRYPDGRYPAPTMYSLHDLNNTIQKPETAAYYKARLLAKYPDSHYSKLLNNPNYIQELEEEEQKVVRVYEQVYEKYSRKDYTSVIVDADSAIERFEGDPLIPKFKYIKALSVGAFSGKEEMKEELDSLIAQHPSTEESIQAQEIIDYMYVAFPVIKEADQAREAEEIYTLFDPEQEHHFLIALHSGENVNQVSFDLLNYNLDHFNQYDLNIERVELTDSYNMLAVVTFTNSEGAMRYMQVIEENRDEILAGIPSSQYRMMIISLDNFDILSEQKVFNPYYLFYLNHYLNEE